VEQGKLQAPRSKLQGHADRVTCELSTVLAVRPPSLATVHTSPVLGRYNTGIFESYPEKDAGVYSQAAG
jgi:hypothetical protein